MIFFTRRLYEGYQPNSNWQKRAYKEWENNRRIYSGYAAIIAPLLPKSVVQLDYSGLHDAVVTSIKQGADDLSIVLDTTDALSRSYLFCKEVSLLFGGVRKKIQTKGLVGKSWIEQEVHLCSRAKFSLHVLFQGRHDDMNEIEIEADSLKIKTQKKRIQDFKKKTEKP
jgi:hypothetical protein